MPVSKTNVPLKAELKQYYSKIFVCGDKAAERGVNDDRETIVNARDFAIEQESMIPNGVLGPDRLIRYRENLYDSAYKNAYTDMLKKAYSRNLQAQIDGKGGRSLEEVTKSCFNYFDKLSVYASPNKARELKVASTLFTYDEIARLKEGEAEKFPTNRIDKEFRELNAPDEEGRIPKVKGRVRRALSKADNIFGEVTNENAADKCVDVTAVLMALEQKHATRSGLWKFFHPIDNYREKSAIARITEQMGNTFSQEQINAARNYDYNYHFVSDEIASAQAVHSMTGKDNIIFKIFDEKMKDEIEINVDFESGKWKEGFANGKTDIIEDELLKGLEEEGANGAGDDAKNLNESRIFAEELDGDLDLSVLGGEGMRESISVEDAMDKEPEEKSARISQSDSTAANKNLG